MSLEEQKSFKRTYEGVKASIARDAALAEGLSVYYGVAMDENGYVHPDGSKCKAENIKNCPFFKKEEKSDEKKDDLTSGEEIQTSQPAKQASHEDEDEVEKVKRIATISEIKGIKAGSNPEESKFANVSVDDLDTMTAGSTQSKYRDMRNRLVAYVKSQKLGDGTYKLVDVNDENVTKRMKKENYGDGFMVSFQTTNGEGFNKRRKNLTVPDAEYDSLVEKLAEETGSGPHVGVFGGIPEISFKVASLEKAMDLAKRYNQVSVWDNAMGKRAEEEDEKNELSPDEIGALWAAANILNPDYNWTENQVIKAK